MKRCLLIKDEFPLGPGKRGEAWGRLDIGEGSRTGSKRKGLHEEKKAWV